MPTPWIVILPRSASMHLKMVLSALHPSGQTGVSTCPAGTLPLAVHCHRNSVREIWRTSISAMVSSCAAAALGMSAAHINKLQASQPLHFGPASYFTVYFFANARTAAVLFSAIVASVQSCSTTPRTAS